MAQAVYNENQRAKVWGYACQHGFSGASTACAGEKVCVLVCQVILVGWLVFGKAKDQPPYTYT
jgi:hypothetical protein